MRAHLLALFSLALVMSSAAPRVLADQRQDWMLEVQPVGNKLILDYFGTGAQLTLEHRGSIFGGSNDYRFNVQSALGFPLAQLQATASIRTLFLEFSGTLGYRSVWRNLSFEPGDDGEYCKDCGRGPRRERDPIIGGGTPEPDTDRYPYAEGTVQFYAPFNEWLVFTTFLTARYEGPRPRSYDWYYTNIHDSGVMLVSETVLFLKHRDLGGFAPYLQVMTLPRAGQHDTEVAVGFNAVTRLGLLARNDLVFLTFLVRPGDGQYGMHSYYAPIRALLIYRMVLDL